MYLHSHLNRQYVFPYLKLAVILINVERFQIKMAEPTFRSLHDLYCIWSQFVSPTQGLSPVSLMIKKLEDTVKALEDYDVVVPKKI
jgi:hypothetical protein